MGGPLKTEKHQGHGDSGPSLAQDAVWTGVMGRWRDPCGPGSIRELPLRGSRVEEVWAEKR